MTRNQRRKRTSRQLPKYLKKAQEYRDFDHKKQHEALRQTGDWCEELLVTLTSRPGKPRRSPEWYWRTHRRLLREYNKFRPGEVVKYNICANRGESGKGIASAHLIYENDGCPDLDIFDALWAKEGIRQRITNAGGEATKYFAKNQTEPSRVDEHWAHKEPVRIP